MNVSQTVGGGLGAVIGAAVVAVLKRYTSLDASVLDASVIGSAALSAGVGIGHAVDKYGLAGILNVLLHGVPKAPVVPPTAPSA